MTATGAARRAPAYVTANKIAHAEWKAVVPHLIKENILKETDLSLLASYCILYARWRQAAEDVEKNGQVITITSTTRTGQTQKPVPNPAVKNEVTYQAAMMRAAVKFGLNPLDRSRVEASPFDEADELQRFINDGLDDDSDLYGPIQS